jgi:hypothetical protein
MASGKGGGSEEGLAGFRAVAQLGDELSRHSASRKDCNASALNEESRRFRNLWIKRFVGKYWLKTLKRQVYGRPGFELLRARLLPMSRGSPLHRN